MSDASASPPTTQVSPAKPPRGLLFAIIGMALLALVVTLLVASPNPKASGPPLTGNAAPDFQLASTLGVPFRLGQFKGQELLLVFFRTHT